MSRDAQGSVTRWLAQLKAGEAEAAQPLWERYFERLVRLARGKLRASPRPRADEDEEDVALSAFHSFCAAAQRGRFPRPDDRGDLWRSLVRVTECKAFDQMQRRSALKRGGGRVALEANMRGDVEADDAWDLARVVGTDPSPDFAAQIAEEFQRRMEGLRDPTLQRIALMKPACHTNEEIATELGCALRTVALRLDLIRKRRADEAPP